MDDRTENILQYDAIFMKSRIEDGVALLVAEWQGSSRHMLACGSQRGLPGSPPASLLILDAVPSQQAAQVRLECLATLLAVVLEAIQRTELTVAHHGLRELARLHAVRTGHVHPTATGQQQHAQPDEQPAKPLASATSSRTRVWLAMRTDRSVLSAPSLRPRNSLE